MGSGHRLGATMGTAAYRVGLTLLCAVYLGTGSYAAKELRVATGDVICRDQQRALEFVQQHPDFAPDPTFQCWPVAPFAQVFELRDVAPNIRGRRMVEVQ